MEGGGEPTPSLLLLLLATNTHSSMPNMGPLAAAAAANSVTKTFLPPPLPFPSVSHTWKVSAVHTQLWLATHFLYSLLLSKNNRIKKYLRYILLVF